MVSMGKFEFEKALGAVEKYRVTNLFVVPPMIIALLKQSAVKKYDLSSLKLIISGAAPLGADVMEKCSKNFPPHVEITQVTAPLFLTLSCTDCARSIQNIESVIAVKWICCN